ncbi:MULTISPECIES: phage baseplate assembly protein [Pseudomonas fluorescens group]|uniref:phage baseplate assembly protein domain-containing protein n=1 Tax=Pseudomonas fluorescens group TaxID=136843 RepID=UPI0005C54E7F|nr:MULTISPECIES: phage baseplate assembly protein [Pseudomonas fluorescens group]RTY72314.1 baseplate assembly protein [Pseudomonas veronii]
MSNMARLVRDQVSRVMSNVRQAFRGTAARNTHGTLIGIEMEGLAGESVSGELMQHYGFSSAPLPGAEFIAIPVGGNSKHTVVVASEDGRYRVVVKDGEVALYTDEGDYIHMKRGRLIEIETDTLVVKAKTKVRFETPLIEQTGDIKADGEITDHTRSMQEDRDLYNAHGHPKGPPPEPPQ